MNYKFLIFAIVTVVCLWINGGEAIKGGKPADIRKYPYLVAILRNEEFVCSGAIIHERYVITAATCLINGIGTLIDYPIKVIAGVTEIFRRDEAGHYINTTEYESKYDKAVKRVASAIYPRSYQNESPFKQYVTEDYVFLKLDEKLDFGPHSNLRKIDLPYEDETTSNRVTVAGYGYDNAESNGLVRINELETTIVQNDIFGEDKVVDKSIIIAYTFNRTDGKNHGPCNGDFGAPLISGKKLIGILIYGPSDCGKADNYYYYTRMPTYDKAWYFPINNRFLRHYHELLADWN